MVAVPVLAEASGRTAVALPGAVVVRYAGVFEDTQSPLASAAKARKNFGQGSKNQSPGPKNKLF